MTVVGPAPRPSAAAAVASARAAATPPASASAPPSSARGGAFTPARAARRRGRDGRSSGRGRCGRSSAVGGRAAAGAAALRAPSARRRGAARTSSRGLPAVARRRRRAAGRAPATSSTRRCARPTGVVRGARRRGADHLRGELAVSAPTHPLAAVPEPGAPGALELTLDGAPIPWSSLRFGALPPGAAGARAARRRRRRWSTSPAATSSSAPASPGPLRATWHRPVAGRPRARSPSDADVDPARARRRAGQPGAPGDRRHRPRRSSAAFAHGRGAQRGPGPGRLDAPSTPTSRSGSRRPTASRRPPPQSFTPDAAALAHRRAAHGDARRSSATSTLDLAGACLDARGLLPRPGDLASGRTLDGVERAPPDDGPAGRRRPCGSAAARGALALPCRALDPRRRSAPTSARGRSSCEDCDRRRARRAASGSAAATPAGTASDGDRRRGDASTRPLAGERRHVRRRACALESVDAVDCLFLDGVEVVQQQEGCLRHCYLGPDLDAAAVASADLPLRPVPGPDVRLGRLRGGRLLRARARARAPAALGGERRRRGRRVPPRCAAAPRLERLAAAHPRVRPARPPAGLDAGSLGGMMTGDYTKVPLRLDERWTGAAHAGGPRRSSTTSGT